MTLIQKISVFICSALIGLILRIFYHLFRWDASTIAVIGTAIFHRLGYGEVGLEEDNNQNIVAFRFSKEGWK